MTSCFAQAHREKFLLVYMYYR